MSCLCAAGSPRFFPAYYCKYAFSIQYILIQNFRPPVDGVQLLDMLRCLHMHPLPFLSGRTIRDLIPLQEIQHFCRVLHVINRLGMAGLSWPCFPFQNAPNHLGKGRWRGICLFLCRPALQFRNARFQLPQAPIYHLDFSIAVSSFCGYAALLHFVGRSRLCKTGTRMRWKRCAFSFKMNKRYRAVGMTPAVFSCL